MEVLCVYCFDVLVAELEKRCAIPFPAAHLASVKPIALFGSNGDVGDVVSIDTH